MEGLVFAVNFAWQGNHLPSSETIAATTSVHNLV
jgi:hypothetical protein